MKAFCPTCDGVQETYLSAIGDSALEGSMCCRRCSRVLGKPKMGNTRDTSPIDQRWMQNYCDEFLKIAGQLPEGLMRDAVLRRVECVMDLLEAWQKRNWPMEERR